MMKEEKILKEKFGKVNPFTVPEGYFDSFADNLMEQLPVMDARVIDMRTQSWWQRMPLGKVAAIASVVAILGCGALFLTHHDGRGRTPMASVDASHAQEANSEYGTFDEMADYAMMDNQDIYVSLVAEN